MKLVLRYTSPIFECIESVIIKTMNYQYIKIPVAGDQITMNADYTINVPDQPILPYIEGDGIGVDIFHTMIKVIDASVKKAYKGRRKIQWMEIYAGANMSDSISLFEATHGTAPAIAGQNKANPGSIILSAEMMLRHMGWTEAADLVVKALTSTIAAKKVTFDFAEKMDDAVELSCSDFGDQMILCI